MYLDGAKHNFICTVHCTDDSWIHQPSRQDQMLPFHTHHSNISVINVTSHSYSLYMSWLSHQEVKGSAVECHRGTTAANSDQDPFEQPTNWIILATDCTFCRSASGLAVSLIVSYWCWLVYSPVLLIQTLKFTFCICMSETIKDVTNVCVWLAGNESSVHCGSQ